MLGLTTYETLKGERQQKEDKAHLLNSESDKASREENKPYWEYWQFSLPLNMTQYQKCRDSKGYQ